MPSHFNILNMETTVLEPVNHNLQGSFNTNTTREGSKKRERERERERERGERKNKITSIPSSISTNFHARKKIYCYLSILKVVQKRSTICLLIQGPT